MFKNILERVLFFNRDYTRRNGKTLAYYLAIGILASLCTSIFLFVLFNIDKEPEIVYTRSQYMEAVEVLAEKGIVDGYTDGSFQPDKPINYEEFIKMCVSVNYPEIKPSETDYWVSPFYEKALKEGYFKKDEIDDTLYKSNLERIDIALIVGNMLDVPISKNCSMLINTKMLTRIPKGAWLWQRPHMQGRLAGSAMERSVRMRR